jgi:hypothetical protein
LFWKSGSCVRPDCKYRHTDAPIDRSRTLCYFESQPGGCQKPHCSFRHLRKGCSESDDHSSETTNGTTATGSSECEAAACSDQKSDTTSDEPIPDPVVSIPVQPVSFQIAEEDESDAEDEKRLRLGKEPESGDKIVVKSLEQIRMERIFKQDTTSPDSHKRPSSDTNAAGRGQENSAGKSAKRVRLVRPHITQSDSATSGQQKQLTESPADLNFTDLLEGDCTDISTAGDDSDILQEIDKIINS